MFRDSHGVVHTVSSTDPLLDLPAPAGLALADGLLLPGDPDLDVAVERCEAARELVERWQDAFFAALPDEIDLAEEARWAAEAGLSLAELEAGYDDDPDDLADDDLDVAELADEPVFADPLLPPLELAAPEPDDDVPALLPDTLVAVLERELLLLPLRVRLEALVAAAALVASWSDLLADHEKLLGHLVLAHGEPVAGDLGHVQLADRHARRHADSGPGHRDRPPSLGTR